MDRLSSSPSSRDSDSSLSSDSDREPDTAEPKVDLHLAGDGLLVANSNSAANPEPKDGLEEPAQTKLGAEDQDSAKKQIHTQIRNLSEEHSWPDSLRLSSGSDCKWPRF